MYLFKERRDTLQGGMINSMQVRSSVSRRETPQLTLFLLPYLLSSLLCRPQSGHLHHPSTSTSIPKSGTAFATSFGVSPILALFHVCQLTVLVSPNR